MSDARAERLGMGGGVDGEGEGMIGTQLSMEGFSLKDGAREKTLAKGDVEPPPPSLPKSG